MHLSTRTYSLDGSSERSESEESVVIRNSVIATPERKDNDVDSGLSAIQVTGREFIKTLEDAMAEMEADSVSRDEVQKLANFLVSYYTTDKQRTLNETQLTQLTFTFRIESVEKTRACLFNLFQTRQQASEVRRVLGGYLIPTDAFVAYLRGKAYSKKSGEFFRFPAGCNRGGGDHQSQQQQQQQAQATGAQNASEQNLISNSISNSISSDANAGESPVEADLAPASPWRRHDSIMANFLHFVVNMYSRRVPGNLFYSVERSDDANDFFACIKFLQSKLLKCPMRLNGIYCEIWDNYLRVSQQNRRRVRVQELQLYCQPIISHNWGVMVMRPNVMVSDSIDKASFIRVCNECML